MEVMMSKNVLIPIFALFTLIPVLWCTQEPKNSATDKNGPFLSYIPTQDTNVIFDFNDVLSRISTRKAMSHLGIADLICHIFAGNSRDSMENMMFDVLYRVSGDALNSDEPDMDTIIPRHNGKKLPTIMCDWLEGHITSQGVIDKVLPYVDLLDEQNYFSHEREKRLAKKAIIMMFDPKLRCSFYRQIKQGVSMVKQCKEHGHKVYLLSNMDSEFIKLYQDKHPELFDLFDGVIISADVKAIKPYKQIYDYTLATYRMDPERSYFIDDQSENIIGAQESGITGIQCDFRRYKDVARALKNHGVLGSVKKA
jgi:FMN phosphatase YigB (HAD superfamily)